MIKHIVLMKFTDPATHAPEAMARLLGMKADIPEILDIRVGLDLLHSARSYDLALEVTVADLAALKVYADHPKHLPVKEYIHARRSASVTVDYEF